jgi:putative dimethyl sulfoxide reductase chaperone
MTIQPIETLSPDAELALSAQETAQARSRIYTLCSRLFLHGPTPALEQAVMAVPELAAAYTPTVDPDQAAAGHQALFGFEIFPYQSIFLDPSGLLGGDESVRVQRSYTQCGFAPATSAESPDHIGHELACMAHLCTAESEALADERAAVVQQVRQLQLDLLQNHLLQWLPPLVLAIQRQQQPFYRALADLTLALVDHHLTEVQDGHLSVVATRDTAEHAATALPQADPTWLEEHNTSLQDIAAWLLRPVYSGLFLSREDLGRLARRHQLPRGFGDRALLLVNLLRAAIKYQCLDPLLTDLHDLVTAEAVSYQRLATQLESSALWLASWHERTTATASLILQMKNLAAQQEQN